MGWEQARNLLAFLETSAAPEDTEPGYLHPNGGQDYGPYGMNPVGYQEVQRINKQFKNVPWDDMIADRNSYESAAKSLYEYLLTRQGDPQRALMAWAQGDRGLREILQGKRKAGPNYYTRQSRMAEWLKNNELS
jgi:hypothetical protein